jgi:hypothetical protein
MGLFYYILLTLILGAMAMKRNDVLTCRKAIKEGKSISITRYDNHLKEELTELIKPNIKDNYIHDPEVILPNVSCEDIDIWSLPSTHKWYRRNHNSMEETISRHIAFRNQALTDDQILNSVSDDNQIIKWEIIGNKPIKEYKQSWRKIAKIEKLKNLKVTKKQTIEKPIDPILRQLVCVSIDHSDSIIRIPRYELSNYDPEGIIYRSKADWKLYKSLTKEPSPEPKISERNYKRIIQNRRKIKQQPSTKIKVTQKYELVSEKVDVSPLGNTYTEDNFKKGNKSVNILSLKPIKKDNVNAIVHCIKTLIRKIYIPQNQNNFTKLKIENKDSGLKFSDKLFKGKKETNNEGITIPIILANNTNDCVRIPKSLLKKTKTEIKTYLEATESHHLEHTKNELIDKIYYYNRKKKKKKSPIRQKPKLEVSTILRNPVLKVKQILLKLKKAPF